MISVLLVNANSNIDGTGVVPNEPEMLQLANGDLVDANPPIWGIDIKVCYFDI